jgi:hypothetical protein
MAARNVASCNTTKASPHVRRSEGTASRDPSEPPFTPGSFVVSISAPMIADFAEKSIGTAVKSGVSIFLYRLRSEREIGTSRVHWRIWVGRERFLAFPISGLGTCGRERLSGLHCGPVVVDRLSMPLHESVSGACQRSPRVARFRPIGRNDGGLSIFWNFGVPDRRLPPVACALRTRPPCAVVRRSYRPLNHSIALRSTECHNTGVADQVA